MNSIKDFFLNHYKLSNESFDLLHSIVSEEHKSKGDLFHQHIRSC